MTRVPDPIDQRVDRYIVVDVITRVPLAETFTRRTRSGGTNVNVNGLHIPSLAHPEGVLCLEDGREIPLDEVDADWGTARRR